LTKLVTINSIFHLCPVVGWNTELNLWEWEQGTILSFPSKLREGVSCQSLSGSEMAQLLPGEIRNIFDHLGESDSELKSKQSKSSIAACPVGSRDHQLLTNQLLGDHFREQACTSQPIPPRKTWAQTT
jgi:hypothetical protein